jgi:hypothetical protein
MSTNTNRVDTSRVDQMALRQRIAAQAIVRNEIVEEIERAEAPFKTRIGAIEDEMAEATRLLRNRLDLHDEENAVDDNCAADFDENTALPVTCCVSGLVLLESDDVWTDGNRQALAAVLPVPQDEIPAATLDVDDEAA